MAPATLLEKLDLIPGLIAVGKTGFIGTKLAKLTP
jgi:hypothetical protein